MSSFHNIQQKLHGFIRKYYTNELIKGSILFISFGLLYFLFTLLVEYFLWLDPIARTILFWIFILVELSLLLKYILFPLFKLLGLSKGINLEDASVIIGTHFKEIDDKLVNMLQLNDGSFDSEFALASIAQRADELEPIPFKKAITFKKNKKYIKYLLIPLVIWLLTMFSGEEEVLSSSYKRVINHQQVYIPPAPFLFSIKNPTLSVIEGNTLELVIETQGNVVPNEAKIIYNDEDYFLKNKEIGVFGFSFENVQKPITFKLKANDVTSKEYKITVIQTPKIQGVSMYLDYPNYVQKKDELIKNTGNVIIPTGTNITWKIATEDTDSLHFVTEQQRTTLSNKVNPNEYRLTKNIRNSINYQLKASNKHLKDFENLSFGISVIQDELPYMDIKTDIDSISRGEAQFVGHLSDDYGLSKLQIEYYPKLQKEQIAVHVIPISKSTIADFYYIFPRNLNLIAGVDYEFYFKVFDNDAVKGSKSVKSKTYSYHKDTENEVQEKLLEEQKQSLDDFNKTLEKQKKNQLDLDKLKKDLQNKSEMEFNDTKKLEQFMKRQKEYQEMMQRQTEELQKNLEQQPELDNEQLQEKKEDIQKRLEESKKLAKNEKLLEELRKLAEKMKKEDLVEKIKKLSKNNQQKEKSLEQLLELTKRFYVEQKAEQISEDLKELAKKQEELSEKPKEENTKE